MIFMNHLVFLDRGAGELEKILSGVKCMLVKEIQPAQAAPMKSGDTLYFLRDGQECTLRVKASVVRVFTLINGPDEDLARTLKEYQTQLQLTEEQYNCWSTREWVQLVEFDHAQKINLIQVAADKVAGQSNWIAFEDFSHIT
jgi:hypothetical protein